MKIACVYRSIDLDGWMSAAIVKHWFNSTVEIPNKKDEPINTLDFIGYNYGQPIPYLLEYDQVIMVDVSFPFEELKGKSVSRMFQLFQKLNANFIWIDHHISAIKDNIGLEYINDKGEDTSTLFNGLRNTKYAACELTWQYFFPNEPMPEIVRLLGRYDCFGHKGTAEEIKVLEFQYGARQSIENYEDAYNALKVSIINKTAIEYDTVWFKIWIQGKSIYQYLYTEAKQVYKNGFEILLLENKDNETIGNQVKKFICINKERFNPINFGINYHDDGYDGAACFHRITGGKWAFSLYNDNGEVDCSAIAKQFGGGGNKGAAEFVVKNLNEIF